jgi:hypothetical protein
MDSKSSALIFYERRPVTLYDIVYPPNVGVCRADNAFLTQPLRMG